MGNCLTTPDPPKENGKKILVKGTVVLMKKNTLDMNDTCSSFLDRAYEVFGNGVSLQLISVGKPQESDSGVPNGRLLRNEQLLGKEAYLEDWKTKLPSLTARDDSFKVTFEWDESMGVPGAVIVRNHHHSEFYFKTLTLEDLPGHDGPLHFVCYSWVYPTKYYAYDRVFFANKTYLPCDTPEPLLYYREQELVNLRGKGSDTLKEWDRVYDYAYYNDLGMPEKGEDYARPVLGGSEEYPYPRRVRTSRKPNKADPNTESRLFLLSINIYVPRDELFNVAKMSDFLAYSAKSIGQVLKVEASALFDKTPKEFDSFGDIVKMYDGSVPLEDGLTHPIAKSCIPWELLKELNRSDGEKFLHYPVPGVIKEDKSAWRTDEEFGREMLAGVNPVMIRLLQEFPPASKLDPAVYGNQTSSMTRQEVEKNMNGLSVDEAIEKKKLFILDHHDAIMSYLSRINTTFAKIYATRTVLLLQEDGTLKPLTIELSLPQDEGNPPGAKSKVFTPAQNGVEASIWQLAKAYAAVNDSGYHQLICHWLNTHAVIEPFIIAANRQLSVLHPIFKLLLPHFRNTLYVNALARQILINAEGVLELTVFPRKYAMEMSSAVYKNWNFTEQGLPADLLKRGVAVPDASQPGGVKLLIEDYPFAVDGLEIWAAIEEWVKEYCSFYYPTDANVQGDTELQGWWAEVRNEGHGDLKNEPWWPTMQTRGDLIQSCTTIIWVASALHAAVNFGQYPYAGYLPNRPTVSRRFMPEPGTPEYEELEKDPELGFLKTITAQLQTLMGVSLIEMLSRHTADEIYLGQREDTEWTSDANAREAFGTFGKKLEKIERDIVKRNDDEKLKNRSGPVKLKYTLLYPGLSNPQANLGLTGKGIPNSVSI